MKEQNLKSMTAFIQHRSQGEWGHAIWELRSVNHRYLDLSIRLPDELRELEPHLREITREYIHRGKLECQLRFTSAYDPKKALTIDQHLLESLIDISKKITTSVHEVLPFHLIDLLKWPGVVTIQEGDISDVKPILLAEYQVALNKLLIARQREGSALKEIMMNRLLNVQDLVNKITKQLPLILKMQREQLEQRLAEINVTYDIQRLEQELVFLAQRSDVMEEIERLRTHVIEVQRILEEGGVVGRQLDFFMQELNREANTLGSKSANAELTQTAVELKILIEQMREQIQNIE